MHRNVGGYDRGVRLIVGVVLALVAVFAPVALFWKVISGVFGAIALVTGAVAYCPLNQAFGIDSRHPPVDRGGERPV